jgi:hypothetical protein
MGRLLLAAVVAGGALAPAGAARADGNRFEPHATSVTWPSVTPSGWYTNTYNYAWYYPWYAHYDYTKGPYANWMVGGGYAGYANHGSAGMVYSNKPPTEPYIGDWYQLMLERNAVREAKLAAQQYGRPTTGYGAYDSLQGLTGNPYPR